jgi:hypothetical protein
MYVLEPTATLDTVPRWVGCCPIPRPQRPVLVQEMAFHGLRAGAARPRPAGSHRRLLEPMLHV